MVERDRCRRRARPLDIDVERSDTHAEAIGRSLGVERRSQRGQVVRLYGLEENLGLTRAPHPNARCADEEWMTRRRWCRRSWRGLAASEPIEDAHRRTLRWFQMIVL